MIQVNQPLLDGNERKYLNECIDTGWISSEGPFVSRFEDEFAMRVQRKHGIAVSNGTVAIDAAIEALGIGPGDEVIMPTFTIISCIAHLIRIGAVPVLVDSCPDTWNMNVNQIEEKITSRTKAIMVVHIFGLPVDIDPVLEIAKNISLKCWRMRQRCMGKHIRASRAEVLGTSAPLAFIQISILRLERVGWLLLMMMSSQKFVVVYAIYAFNLLVDLFMSDLVGICA